MNTFVRFREPRPVMSHILAGMAWLAIVAGVWLIADADLFHLEHMYPASACILYTVLWAVVSAGVLWPFSREKLLDRLPFVLSVVLELFLAAITILPRALPGLFQTLTGHSIYAVVTTTQSTGTLLSEPWIENWQGVVEASFLWVVVIGGLWAFVNLCRRRSWVSNGIVIAYVALVWFFGHAFVM